jgi:hypothetical protein
MADGDGALGGGGRGDYMNFKVEIFILADLTAPQRMLAYLRLAQ